MSCIRRRRSVGVRRKFSAMGGVVGDITNIITVLTVYPVGRSTTVTDPEVSLHS